MNRFLIYILASVALTAMGLYQETSVYRAGHLALHRAAYGQVAGIGLCTLATLLLLLSMPEGSRSTRESAFRLSGLPFWPWVFALPLLWHQSSTFRDGTETSYTEVSSGIGGPFTFLYFAVAAGAFISCEAWLKARERANKALEPTSTSGTSAAEQPRVPAAAVAHL